MSDDTYDVQWSCARKHGYLRYEQAKRAMKNTRRRKEPAKIGAILEVYHCPYCSHYHVGHRVRGR